MIRRKLINANLEELKKLAELEEKFNSEKIYKKILDEVLNNLPVINNKKLCEILSEETNTKFVAKIKAVPTILHSSKATLCFENKDESIEAFHTVTKDYKKLKNINWFKVFIEDTKKMGDSLLYTNIVDAPSDVVDNEYVMPVTLDKTIQKALTNYINNFNMIEYASTIQPPIQGNKTEINK